MIVADVVSGTVSNLVTDAIEKGIEEIDKEEELREQTKERNLADNRINPVDDCRERRRRRFLDEWRKHPWKPRFFFLTGLATVALFAGATLLMAGNPEIVGQFPWMMDLLAFARNTPGRAVFSSFLTGNVFYMWTSIVREVLSTDLRNLRHRRRCAKRLRRLARKKGPLERARPREMNISNELIFIRNGDLKSISLDVPEKYIEIKKGVSSMRNPAFFKGKEAGLREKTLVLPSTCREAALDVAPGNVSWAFDSFETMERLCRPLEFHTDGTGGGVHMLNGRTVRIEGETYFSHIAAVDALNASKENTRDWWSEKADPAVIQRKSVKRGRQALLGIRRLHPGQKKALADEAWELTRVGRMKIGEFLAILDAAGLPKDMYRQTRGVIRIEGEEEGRYISWHTMRWKASGEKGRKVIPSRGPALVCALVEKRELIAKEERSRAMQEKAFLRREARESEMDRLAAKIGSKGKRKRRSELDEIEKRAGKEVRTEIERRLLEQTQANSGSWRETVHGREM